MRRTTAFLSRLALAGALLVGTAQSAFAVQQPDAWITTKVKIALLTDQGLKTTGMNVDTVDGLVTLHGRVANDAEKVQAAKVARGIQGVRDVRNLLQIEPASGAKAAAVADDQLETKVSSALKADPALGNSSVKVVSVKDGIVLLGGKAATLGDHYRAIEVASRVDGVRRVASEIESPDTLADEELWRDAKPDAPDAVASAEQRATDMWITSAAKMRLLANADTPAFDINVDTDDGRVTLFGMVDSAAAKQQAEAEVRKVEGVKNVVNDLQVVADAKQERVEQSDEAILKAIESRFARRDSLKESKITVEVSNGVARLSGHVDSWSEHLTALTLARSTSGVKKVIDDLQVEAKVSQR